MSTRQTQQDGATDVVKQPTMNMRLEVIVIPVADVDRALRFYQSLGGGSMRTTRPVRNSGSCS